MTKAPVLMAGEREQLYVLTGLLDGLMSLAGKTKIKEWNNVFTHCHDLLNAVLQARFLCFKDGGALKRLDEDLINVKMCFRKVNTDLTRDGEEMFKVKVASEDIYTMAEMLQSCKCQNCHENKGECLLFGIFNKYYLEEFNDKPDKGVCPYSVILEGGDE